MATGKFKRLNQVLGVSVAIASLSGTAYAQSTISPMVAGTASSSYSNDAFSVFVPKPQSLKLRLDYEVWDEALKNVVLELGPSTRLRARKPQAEVGTRMVKGHKSAYRLEGTRVTFAYLNDTYKAGLTEYRKDLERITNKIDIASLSRNEQLAFWFNLHNVAMIESIANNYPVDRPENIKIKIDGEKYNIDDAKLLTIAGQKLSLRDIRENIVYRNWQNPDVMYGFFRGNIGSPSLPRTSYTAENLDYNMTRSAEEFVNSLRGFHVSSRARNVSAIYEEARPFYFQNWEQDLEAHLLKHANENVYTEVQTDAPFKIDRYDEMIADLSGGRRLASSGNPRSGSSSMSYETERLLREVREKQRYLKRNDMVKEQRGYVIIEDLTPADTAPPPPTIVETPEE